MHKLTQLPTWISFVDDGGDSGGTGTGDNPTGQQQQDDQGGPKLLTQEEVDAIVEKRLGREKAKYADYDQLKSAAQKLQEIEDSQKTEAEKAEARAAAAEAEAEKFRTQAVRAEVASEKGVPLDLLSGPQDSSPEALADYAEKLLAFRGEQPTGPRSSALRDVNRQQVKGTTAEQFGSFLEDLF